MAKIIPWPLIPRPTAFVRPDPSNPTLFNHPVNSLAGPRERILAMQAEVRRQGRIIDRAMLDAFASLASHTSTDQPTLADPEE